MSKDLTTTNNKDVEVIHLNPKQELFCQLYASDREFFGNGTQSYIEAYDLPPSKYKTAVVNASKLLTKPNILKRINQLLELKGLNDEYVDKQLEMLITQNADFKAKISAIKEYNSLKRRTGSVNPEGTGNTYNTFIQQNNYDPNKIENKTLVDKTLDMLMEQTKLPDELVNNAEETS